MLLLGQSWCMLGMSGAASQMELRRAMGRKVMDLYVMMLFFEGFFEFFFYSYIVRDGDFALLMRGLFA